MQTYQILISPEALAALQEIHDAIASSNPLNASAFAGQLLRQIDGLATFPHRFAVAPEARHFKEPLRHVILGNYRIVYRITAASVEIVAIRHAARRPLQP